MYRSLSVFSLVFLVAALLQALVYQLLGLSVFNTFLFPSYAMQGILGLFSVWILLRTAQSYQQHVAFVFMGLSFLKFGLYFVFFHPYLKADGILSSIEKIDVILPYFVALALETVLGVQRLNKL